MFGLDAFITTQIFIFMLLFARIGGALMILPGFSDSTVPMEIRLYMGLALTLVLMPVLQKFVPPIPKTPIAYALLIGRELLTGIFIGLVSQLIINAMNVAGVIIAHATSLSSAFIFNPQQGTQMTVITGFLSLLVVVLIFVTDLHHMLLIGIVDSYGLFDPSGLWAPGDMADMIARRLSDSFAVGLRLAAPFVVVSMGVFIAMGLVARLVPQIQVFILSIPLQIAVGLVLFMTTVSAMLLFFLSAYQESWQALFLG